MNFGFSEEQELLRSSVRTFLDESCPLAEVRKIAEGPGFSPALWKQVCGLGWSGLLVPEAQGGAGLGFEDLVVVLEETGRSLFPSPLISTGLAARALCRTGSPAQRERWLPPIADGSLIATLALWEDGEPFGAEGVKLEGAREGGDLLLRGVKLPVPDAPPAGLFLVAYREPRGVGLALVEREAPGVSVDELPGIDTTKRQGRLRLEGVRVAPEAILAAPPEAERWLDDLLDAGATAVALEAVGAAEAALALTVGYARQRIQFGRPIGQFQSVKHPLAEMHRDVESVKSLAYYAAWCLDHDRPETSAAASRAKALMSETFPRIGLDAVGLHGGIGYTWEYDAQLFLKRLRWARPAFGDADQHYERVAALGGP